MVVIRRSEGTGAVRAMRRKKAGSNPTDRRKLGSKHHLIVDAQGIPLAVILSGANSNDFMELDPLVEAIPPIREKRDVLRASRKSSKATGATEFRATPTALAQVRHHPRACQDRFGSRQQTRQNLLGRGALDCLAPLVQTPEDLARTICPCPRSLPVTCLFIDLLGQAKALHELTSQQLNNF